MTESQFVQLLSAASSISTTLEFQTKQVDEFAAFCVHHSSEISTKVDEICNSLQIIANNPPPLSKVDADALAKLKVNLAKITRDLEKELEKPSLQYKKGVDKLQLKISEKIIPKLAAPCKFNLEQVRKHASKAQGLIKQINLALDRCFKALRECQEKLGKTSLSLQRLDLPNEIQTATKQVTKVTREIETLNGQLLDNPEGTEHYKMEFLPLYAALEGLRVQSDVLTSTSKPSPSQ